MGTKGSKESKSKKEKGVFPALNPITTVLKLRIAAEKIEFKETSIMDENSNNFFDSCLMFSKKKNRIYGINNKKNGIRCLEMTQNQDDKQVLVENGKFGIPISGLSDRVNYFDIDYKDRFIIKSVDIESPQSIKHRVFISGNKGFRLLLENVSHLSLSGTKRLLFYSRNLSDICIMDLATFKSIHQIQRSFSFVNLKSDNLRSFSLYSMNSIKNWKQEIIEDSLIVLTKYTVFYTNFVTRRDSDQVLIENNQHSSRGPFAHNSTYGGCIYIYTNACVSQDQNFIFASGFTLYGAWNYECVFVYKKIGFSFIKHFHLDFEPSRDIISSIQTIPLTSFGHNLIIIQSIHSSKLRYCLQKNNFFIQKQDSIFQEVKKDDPKFSIRHIVDVSYAEKWFCCSVGNELFKFQIQEEYTQIM